MGTVQNCTNWITKQEFLSENILYRDVEIPEEIIEYVARNIKSNVRRFHNILIAQSLSTKKSNNRTAKSVVEKFVKINVKFELITFKKQFDFQLD
jgi:chromosomal replication initiation ATPase DnaA